MKKSNKKLWSVFWLHVIYDKLTGMICMITSNNKHAVFTWIFLSRSTKDWRYWSSVPQNPVVDYNATNTDIIANELQFPKSRCCTHILVPGSCVQWYSRALLHHANRYIEHIHVLLLHFNYSNNKLRTTLFLQEQLCSFKRFKAMTQATIPAMQWLWGNFVIKVLIYGRKYQPMLAHSAYSLREWKWPDLVWFTAQDLWVHPLKLKFIWHGPCEWEDRFVLADAEIIIAV